MLLEMGDSVVQAEDMLLQPSSDGFCQVMLTNMSGISCFLHQRMVMGEAEETVVVSPQPDPGVLEELTDASEFVHVKEHSCVQQVLPQLDPCARKELLWEKVNAPGLGSEEQEEEFKSFLEECHEVFSLEEGE